MAQPATLETDAAEDLCVLPAYVDSVQSLRGDLSIARVRSGSETQIARHLRDEGVDFFNPREFVKRSYLRPGTERFAHRSWDRAVLPGMLVVADGYDGRECAERYGSRFRGRLYRWIGPVYGGGVGRQLRDELSRIERYLEADPSLKQMSGLLPGTTCRVKSGEFEGRIGIVAGEGKNQCLRVTSSLMGADMEITLHASMLEAVN